MKSDLKTGASPPSGSRAAALCGVEISKRPPKSLAQIVHGFVFLVVFLFGCLLIHSTQLLFVVPLVLLPFSWTKEAHEQGVRYTKGAFGALILFACQVFAPTTLRITFETDGTGAFTEKEAEQLVRRDASGTVVELVLPKKMVIIANHQMYVDWWYVWNLTYFMNMHKDVLIVLKKSLKWIPILGWGMQVFRFIFLARSWASDRLHLISRLAELGRDAQAADRPLAFIIYPEGTLVSDDTRPVSKKYADKLGIPDMRHMLLPRSTGLHYALRALAPKVPSLKLLDITVAYPGIPPEGFGQSFYTLRSVFMDGIPPPVVHMHLRLLDVASSVPIGDLSHTDSTALPPPLTSDPVSLPTKVASAALPNGTATHPAHPASVEASIPEHERDKFDLWLRDLWREKDAKMDEYHAMGAFRSKARSVEVPLKLRSVVDMGNAFCWGAPLVAWVAIRRMVGKS